MFGQNPPNAPFGGGGRVAQQHMNTNPSGHGAAPAPAFGQFGAPARTAFGSRAPTPFGSPTPAPNAFGTPSPSAFGAPGAFGVPAPSAFGASAPSTFGAPAPSTFGAPQSATEFGVAPFGAPEPTTFGTPAPSMFWAPNPSTPYGAPDPSAFGASTPSVFGSTTPPTPFASGTPGTGLFRGAPVTGFGPASPARFSAATSTGFGNPAPAPNLFGAPATTPAPFGGTRTTPFVATSKKDGAASISFQSISAMPAFQTKQVEELRIEDYAQGNKGTASTDDPMEGFGVAPATEFGSAPAPSVGLFGQPAPAPAPAFGSRAPSAGLYRSAPTTAGGSLFGSAAPASGIFGQPDPATTPATRMFGQPAPAFGTPAPSTGLFEHLAPEPYGAPLATEFGGNRLPTSYPEIRSQLIGGSWMPSAPSSRARPRGFPKSENKQSITKGLLLRQSSPTVARQPESESRRTKNRLQVSPEAVPRDNSEVPTLTKAGYEVSPTLWDLAQMDSAELATVTGFSVFRPGYGKVEWEGSVDVRNADLDAIVSIELRDIKVYHEQEMRGEKPEEGRKLNRPARVSFYKVFPRYATYEGKEEMERKVRLKTSEMGAELLSYNSAAGVWRIRVRHFSRYYLHDDSSEAEDATNPHVLQSPAARSRGHYNHATPVGDTEGYDFNDDVTSMEALVAANRLYQSIQSERSMVDVQDEIKVTNFDLEDKDNPICSFKRGYEVYGEDNLFPCGGLSTEGFPHLLGHRNQACRVGFAPNGTIFSPTKSARSRPKFEEPTREKSCALLDTQPRCASQHSFKGRPLFARGTGTEDLVHALMDSSVGKYRHVIELFAGLSPPPVSTREEVSMESRDIAASRKLLLALGAGSNSTALFNHMCTSLAKDDTKGASLSPCSADFANLAVLFAVGSHGGDTDITPNSLDPLSTSILSFRESGSLKGNGFPQPHWYAILNSWIYGDESESLADLLCQYEDHSVAGTVPFKNPMHETSSQTERFYLKLLRFYSQEDDSELQSLIEGFGIPSSWFSEAISMYYSWMRDPEASIGAAMNLRTDAGIASFGACLLPPVFFLREVLQELATNPLFTGNEDGEATLGKVVANFVKKQGDRKQLKGAVEAVPTSKLLHMLEKVLKLQRSLASFSLNTAGRDCAVPPQHVSPK